MAAAFVRASRIAGYNDNVLIKLPAARASYAKGKRRAVEPPDDIPERAALAYWRTLIFIAHVLLRVHRALHVEDDVALAARRQELRRLRGRCAQRGEHPLPAFAKRYTLLSPVAPAYHACARAYFSRPSTFIHLAPSASRCAAGRPVACRRDTPTYHINALVITSRSSTHRALRRHLRICRQPGAALPIIGVDLLAP